VSFAAITLRLASQRVFIVVVYFVIDSVPEPFGYTLVQLKVHQLLKRGPKPTAESAPAVETGPKPTTESVRVAETGARTYSYKCTGC
jgi:hypothetical protein